MSDFFLTRQAAFALRNIHNYSRIRWGEQVADDYIKDLYAAINKAATRPETGQLRQPRSSPFLMVPARQHFIIYDIVEQSVVILAIENQVRDIETLVAEFAPKFFAEIEKLKRR
jgi:plasmid stabilization system protein ParE